MSTETVHELKVVQPYFDALATGDKTFEVRRNDRAYQRGDVLRLREWHPDQTTATRPCDLCGHWEAAFGHWGQETTPVERSVTFVYSGDPRFGGVEAGYVVLALGPVQS